MFGRLGVPLLLLLLNDVQVGVVSDKLFQRNEEVAQAKSKLIVLRIEGEESLDECIDLGPL